MWRGEVGISQLECPQCALRLGRKDHADSEHVGRVRFADPNLEPVEPRLLPQVALTRNARIPQHELRNWLATTRRVRRQERSHTKANKSDRRCARHPAVLDRRCDSVEPALDLIWCVM